MCRRLRQPARRWQAGAIGAADNNRPVAPSSPGDRCVWPSVAEAVGRTSHGARLMRLASAGPRDEGPWRQPPLATAGSSWAVALAIVSKTDFYSQGWSSYAEALSRVKGFKQYVENQDGWQLINRGGKPFAQEKEVQLYFGLIWFGSAFDVNREPNNGRGPVDFKVSIGAADKSLIEFKLASNSQLKRNLQKQVEIYEKANQTVTSVKVIICYTEAAQARVTAILKDLKLTQREDIVVIDARSDDKP